MNYKLSMKLCKTSGFGSFSGTLLLSSLLMIHHLFTKDFNSTYYKNTF